MYYRSGGLGGFREDRRGNDAITALRTGFKRPEQRHRGWLGFRDGVLGASVEAAALAPASPSRFNYVSVKADRPRRPTGVERWERRGGRRAAGDGRCAATGWTGAKERADSAPPPRQTPRHRSDTLRRTHATHKFRNRWLSRVQLVAAEAELAARAEPPPPEPLGGDIIRRLVKG